MNLFIGQECDIPLEMHYVEMDEIYLEAEVWSGITLEDVILQFLMFYKLHYFHKDKLDDCELRRKIEDCIGKYDINEDFEYVFGTLQDVGDDENNIFCIKIKK